MDDTVEDPRRRRSRLGLAALMLVTGVLHFVNPKFYDVLIPSWMPGEPRFWTYASGAVELGAGALTANRSTSKIGAWVTFGLLLAVWPANIQDAIDHPPTDARGIGSLVRAPLQIPLLLWARGHTRSS